MIDSKKLIAMVKKYEKLIYDTADYIWAVSYTHLTLPTICSV